MHIKVLSLFLVCLLDKTSKARLIIWFFQFCPFFLIKLLVIAKQIHIPHGLEEWDDGIL